MSFNELKVLRNASVQSPLGHEVAGELAETEISKNLKSSVTINSKIFSGKRVPRRDSNGRYEIDIIFLTKSHLYVLEVKNYTGTLCKNYQGWQQTKRNGEIIQHEDIINLNQKKLEAIRAYIDDGDLPSDFLQQRVLFYNSINLSPDIMCDPRVITYNQIDNFLPKRSFKQQVEEHFFSALISFLVAEEDRHAARQSLLKDKLSPKQFEVMANSIGSLRTWDEVAMNGGRIVKGDAISLLIQGKEYSLKDLSPNTGFPCKWTRSRLLGFIKAFRGMPLGYLKSKYRNVPLTPSEDRLFMHIVGNPKPEYIPLCDIEWFNKG